MKKAFGLVCAVVAGLIFPATSRAIVITFDDSISYPVGHTFATQGYTFDVLTGHYHIESGTRYGTTSADNSLIIDDFGGLNALTTSGGDAFMLSGFQIKSWGTSSFGSSYGSTTVTLTGHQVGGGLLSYVYTASAVDTWDTVTLNWDNLTSVNFVGSGNSGIGENFFRLDNLAVDTVAVPDPASSLVLMSCALLGLVGLRWAMLNEGSPYRLGRRCRAA